jgi:hypothetical protein
MVPRAMSSAMKPACWKKDEVGKLLSTLAQSAELAVIARSDRAPSAKGGMNIMDMALYDRDMAMRRKVLGDEYVDRAVANTDEFNRKF